MGKVQVALGMAAPPETETGNEEPEKESVEIES